MSTKNHNLTPLAARILSIIENAGDCTRKDIATQLGRKRSQLLSNDIIVLQKLAGQGSIEVEEYGGGTYRKFFIYRTVK